MKPNYDDINTKKSRSVFDLNWFAEITRFVRSMSTVGVDKFMLTVGNCALCQCK